MLGIIFPALLVPGVLLFPSLKRRILMFSFIAALVFLTYYILSGAELGSSVWLAEDGVLAPFFFTEHPYSRMAILGFTVMGALALLYGVQLSKPSEQAISLLALASAIGIVFSGNFITLFLFWEMLTFTTAGLIFCKGDHQAIKMGLRFLYFHLAGGLLIFLGILMHFSATGSFIITTPQAGLIFFVLGVGCKAAFLPLHLWVAWGYPSASFPSSVLLAGLTTKIGIYALARIIPPHQAIVLMGGIMSVVAVTCALMQHDLRRLLAFHVISQVGYMVAGVGLGTSIGVDGGMLHMINNMFYKGLLFMCAGAVIYATGTGDIHKLIHFEDHDTGGGNKEEVKPLWKAMPVATIGAVVGGCAIAGMPFFSGYVSKYMLKNAMEGVGPTEWLLIIASVGTAVSFCKFVYFGFIKARARIINRPNVTMRAAILGGSSLCILLGVYPEAISTLLPHNSSLQVYSASGIWVSLQLIIVGALVFLNLTKPLEKGIHVPDWMSIENLIFAPLARVVYQWTTKTGARLENCINSFCAKFGEGFLNLCSVVNTMDSHMESFCSRKTKKGLINLCHTITSVDRELDSLYGSTSKKGISNLTGMLSSVDHELDNLYDESSNIKNVVQKVPSLDGYSYVETKVKNSNRGFQKVFSKFSSSTEYKSAQWSTKNLSFDQLLLISLLGMIIFVFLYFAWARGLF